MRPLAEVFVNLTGKDLNLQSEDGIVNIPAVEPAVAFDRDSFVKMDVRLHGIRVDQPVGFKLTHELPPVTRGVCLLVNHDIHNEYPDRPDLFCVPSMRMTVLRANTGGADFLRLALDETEYITRLREALTLLAVQPDTQAVRDEHRNKTTELKVALKDHYAPEAAREVIWNRGRVAIVGHPRWKHSWLIPGQARIDDVMIGAPRIVIQHDQPGYVVLVQASAIPTEGADIVWESEASKTPGTVLNIGARGTWTEQQPGSEPVRWVVENGTAHVVNQ